MRQRNIFLAILAVATIIFSVATVPAYYGGQRISGWQLLDNTITTYKILNYTIVNADISPTAGINSSQILDSTIANADIAPNSINNSQIQASAVNDTQLASGAINGAVNKQTTEISVTGTTYSDAINKTITLNRTSLLIIIYAAQSKNEGGNATIIRCNVSSVAADPAVDIQFMLEGRGSYGAASYLFYNSSVVAGTHNVNISMRSNSTGTVYVMNQSIAIQALPA